MADLQQSNGRDDTSAAAGGDKKTYARGDGASSRVTRGRQHRSWQRGKSFLMRTRTCGRPGAKYSLSSAIHSGEHHYLRTNRPSCSTSRRMNAFDWYSSSDQRAGLPPLTLIPAVRPPTDSDVNMGCERCEEIDEIFSIMAP